MRGGRAASAIVLATTGFAASSSAGCASLTFRAQIDAVGEYRDLSAPAERAKEMSSHEAADVKVLMQELPPGVTSEDGVVHVDTSRYEMLGKVEARFNNNLMANLGFWIYDYAADEDWRVGYCAWQVPLSWLTIGMWSIFVPLHYPCHVSGSSEPERKKAIVDTLRRATKALGGDLLIVMEFGRLGNASAPFLSSPEAASGYGYALKRKQGRGVDAPAREPAPSPADRVLEARRPGA